MADPLSISACVVQFLDISVRLCLKLHHLCSEMHDVPHKLRGLEADIREQTSVVEGLRALTTKSNSNIEPSSLKGLETILEEYSRAMERLLGILDSVSSSADDGLIKRSWNAIRAIDKKGSILQCCDHLAQKRSLLSLWLHNCNMYVPHYGVLIQQPRRR